ncbi:MAG: GspE/PulE family protein [bacterium JZ-2024 1]
MTNKPLGKILVEEGIINAQQLEMALREQKRTKELLGKILKRLGLITEKDLVKALALQAGIEFIEVNNVLVEPSTLSLLPAQFAKQNKVLPLFVVDGTLSIAVADPHNVMLVDQVKKTANISSVRRYAAEEDKLLKAIETFYEISAEQPETIIERSISDALASRKIEEAEEDPPIIRLVNYLIIDALKRKATDIHIEPDERITRVRYRLDGILHSTYTLPKSLHSPVTARIKIMGKMDIAEQRLPQDGGATFAYQNRTVDLRISTVPTLYGEKLVIRILDKESIRLNLDALGFSPQHLEAIRRLISQPYGIILVTGPTGSGKTTTLYSVLLELNSLEVNIMTIEDPIEYRLPLINQVQVNEKAGLTFATAMRSFLRQDPDVILIGEIRDAETAEMALRAAMTGHLVFSTLHTNDAVGAIPRLIDIGVPPYLIASSLLGVLAQRLVRKICPHCKIPYQPSEADLKYLPLPSQWRGTLYKGQGCPKCFHTGYSGRTVIAEVLEVDDSLRKLFSKNVSSDELLKAAKKKGFRTMFWDGVDKVLEGKTTLQELMRVVILPQEETPIPKLEEKTESIPFIAPTLSATPPREIPRGSLTHLFQKILNQIPEIEGIFCYDEQMKLLDYARFSEELPHPSEQLEKDLKDLLAYCPDFSQGFLSNKNHLIFLWRAPSKKTLLLFTMPSKHYSRAFIIDALNQVLSAERL